MGFTDRLKAGARNALGLGQRMDAASDVAKINELANQLHSIKSRIERREDAFSNSISGMGNPDYDARQWTRPVYGKFLHKEELDALYLHEESARKVVDVPVGDAARTGFRVLVNDDDAARKKTEPFKQALGALELERRCKKAHTHVRKYGGAAIVMLCDDLAPIDEPIDYDSLRNIDALKVFHRFEIKPWRAYDTSRLGPKWGETELFELRPETPFALQGVTFTGRMLIHESRVIPFFGREVGEEMRSYYDGWGQPHLEASYATIENLGVLFSTAASKTQELVYDVHKVHGLADLMFGQSRHTPGKTALEDRVRIVKLLKSIYRVILVDAENEDWETRSIDFKGIRELFEVFSQQYSLSTDLPLTKALGQSPAGFNSADKTGERNYYDGISSQQEELWKPAIDKVVHVLSRASEGPTRGEALEEWEVIFGDHERPSPKEEAEIRKLHTEADKIVVDLGVMDPDEARRRYEQGEFSTDIALERREPKGDDGGGDGSDGGGVRRQEQMPNGAQMSAIKDIAESMFLGKLPRASSVGMTGFFLAVPEQEAQKILGLDDPVAVAWLDRVQEAAGNQTSSPPPPPQPTAPDVEQLRSDALDWREDYSNTSMMIALFPPSEWAERCAPYTDIPLDELHLTLVYLPDVDDRLAENILATMASLAPTLEVLTLGVTGPSAFFNDASIARVLLLSGLGLARLRAQVVAALEQRGQLTRQNHDFIPHLTLGYRAPKEGIDPDLLVKPMEVTWPTFKAGHLAIVRGGQKFTFPMGHLAASQTTEEE